MSRARSVAERDSMNCAHSAFRASSDRGAEAITRRPTRAGSGAPFEPRELASDIAGLDPDRAFEREARFAIRLEQLERGREAAAERRPQDRDPASIREQLRHQAVDVRDLDSASVALPFESH